MVALVGVIGLRHHALCTHSTPFPFRRTGRVVYSSRGLYGLAGAIVLIVLLIGALPIFYAGNNSAANTVVLYGFLTVLLAMAAWSAYCGRRVQRWEREQRRREMGLITPNP